MQFIIKLIGRVALKCAAVPESPFYILCIDNGKINSTILLDVNKAFDTIDHDILLQKLSHYGILHIELEFFRSYLCNRLQCCSVNGHTSSFRMINCGGPQGSVLGPLLFIICVNDLPLCVENGHVTIYADDTSCSNGISTVEDITRNFIPDIKNVMDWLKANNLSLNVMKTEFILMGTTQNILKIGDLLAIRVQGHTVKCVYKAKYLGMVIDDKLTWKDHIDHVSLKIKHNLGIMKCVRNDIPKESLIALYRTMVEPYLRYCNNIWGKCCAMLIGKLQTLQNRVARIITNATYDNTDNAKLLRQLNRLNVPQLIDFETASLMYKIENGPVPAHLKQMFVKLEDLHSYDMRSANSGNFHLPKRRPNIGQTAFSFHGASLWNQLPYEIKKAQSLESFQKLIKGYIMNQ